MSEELSGTLRASSRKCVNAEFSSQMMGAAERIEELEQERDRLKGWWEVEQEKVTEAEYRLSEAVKVLEEAKTWHEGHDKSLSKQPPTHGPSGNQWARLQHREQIDILEAFLATLGGYNE